MSPSIGIRAATASDAPAIASVFVDTWRSTFRGTLSDAFLEGMSVDHQTDRYRRILARPNVCCFLAVNPASCIVGFCCGGPNRSPELPEQTEIYAIYVRNQHHGNGAGRKLFDTVAQQLFYTIGSGLAVWVIASNPFRPFYERMGGKEAAYGEVTLGAEKVRQVAYTWIRPPALHNS